MKRTLVAIALWLSCSQSLSAQDKFHIFLEFADGVFSDGSSYRSTLTVLPWFDTDTPNCTLVLYGLSATFEGGVRNTSFSFTIPAGGYVASPTTAGQGLAAGYATLTCTDYVYANVLYSYYAPNGAKLSEATVFSTTFESFRSRMILDQRNGSQLGIAIANNTDVAHIYDVKLLANTGTRTTSLTVPARRSIARFVSEILLGLPPNSVGILTVPSRDYSDFSMIGLRYTGATFTTIPGN